MPVKPPVSQTPISTDAGLLGASVPGAPPRASAVPYKAAPISHTHQTSQSPLIPKGFGGMLSYNQGGGPYGGIAYGSTAQLPPLSEWTLELWVAGFDFGTPGSGFFGLATSGLTGGIPGTGSMSAGVSTNYHGPQLYINGVAQSGAPGAAGWWAISCDGVATRAYQGGNLIATLPAAILPASYLLITVFGNPNFPPNGGFYDEVRVSSVARYTGNTYVLPTSPFIVDADTVALYHMDDLLPIYVPAETGANAWVIVPDVWTADAMGQYPLTLAYNSTNPGLPTLTSSLQVSQVPSDVTNSIQAPFFVQTIEDANGGSTGGGPVVVKAASVSAPTASPGLLEVPVVVMSTSVPQEVAETGLPGSTGQVSDAGHVHVDPLLGGSTYKAVEFDGTSGHVETTYTPPGVTQLTEMVWVKILAYPSNLGGLVGLGNSQELNLFVGSGGNIFLAYKGGYLFSNIVQVGTNNDSLPIGSWVCVVATVDVASGASLTISDMTVYLNGVSSVANNYTNGGPPVAPINVDTPETVAVMYDTGNLQYADAVIAKVALWNSLLTTAQIADLYNNMSTMTNSEYDAYVQSLAPVTYYTLDEGSGTTAVNSGTGGSGDDGTYTGGYTLGQTGPGNDTVLLVTSPYAPTSLTLTSGTAYTNNSGVDQLVRIPIAYSPTATAAATLQAGIGPTATPAQILEDSEPAGLVAGTVRTSSYYLPAGWSLLLTTTNATIQAGTVQSV